MVVRAFWRRISLLQLNLAVYGLLLVLALIYWGDLCWAARNLPRYLRGSIGSPEERQLTLRGRRMLERGWKPELARPHLERALAIDPRCEAGFWLGESLLRGREHARAARQLVSYIDIDPTRVDAYRGAAAAYRELGQREKARAILARGRDYFTRAAKAFKPRPDAAVPRRENRKARKVHWSFKRSARLLRRLIEQLDSPGAGP
jgi:tetratricopeptide (TPR) repeat protein